MQTILEQTETRGADHASSGRGAVEFIEAFGTRVRRVLLLRAILTWLAVVLAVGLLAMGIDAFLRFESVLLRLTSTVAFFSTAGAGAYVWVMRAIFYSPDRGQLARWLERHDPAGQVGLENALELGTLEVNAQKSQSEWYGSQSFRQSASRAWQGPSLERTLAQWVDQASVRRGQFGVAMLCLILLCGLVVSFHDTKLAMARLLSPLADLRWPVEDDLRFVDPPDAVALGYELRLVVVDEVLPAPDDVSVEIQGLDGRDSNIDRIRCQVEGDLRVCELPPMRRDVLVRPVGGSKKKSSWHAIKILQPPTVQEAIFEIVPPAYTRQPKTEVRADRVRVLSGSEIAFRGSFSEQVRDVQLRWLEPIDVGLQRSDLGEAVLDSAGREVHLARADKQPIVATMPLEWSISVELLSGQRVLCPGKWRVDVYRDLPPVVTTEQFDDDRVALGATIGYRGTAEDDIGLASLGIQGTVKTVDGEYEYQRSVEVPDAASPTLSLLVDQRFGMDALAREVGIAPDSIVSVELSLEAVDLAGQTSRSEVRAFKVVSAEAVNDGVNRRFSGIQKRIEELAATQQRLVKSAKTLAQSVRSGDTDVERLRRQLEQIADSEQRLARELTDEPQSIASELRELQNVMQSNGLASDAKGQSIRSLLGEIEAIKNAELSDALKAIYDLQVEMNRPEASVAELPFQEKAQGMTQATDVLASRLESLANAGRRVSQHQEVAAELRDVWNEQQQLLRDAERLQFQHVEAPSSDEIAARTKQAAREQNELASRLRDLVDGLSSMEPAGSNAALEELRTRIEQSDVIGDMRWSATALSQMQFNESIERQKEVLRELGDMEALANRKSSPMDDSMQKRESLQVEAAELGNFAQRQEQLAELMKSAVTSQQLQQAAANQDQLREQTSDWIDKHHDSPESVAGLEEVLQQQGQASEQARRGESSQASESATQAAKALRQQQQAAVEQEDELKNQEERELLQQLVQQLSSIAIKQVAIVDQLTAWGGELKELREIPATDDEYRQLADQQRLLEAQLRRLMPIHSSNQAVQWALTQAADAMTRTSAYVVRQKVAPEGVYAAQSSLDRIAALIDSLKKQDAAEQRPGDSTQSDQSEQESEKENKQNSLQLGLALLQALQERLNQRSKSLLGENDVQQVRVQLATEQQELADFLNQLLDEIEQEKQP